MRYVAMRPGLKRILRPLIASFPFLYQWLVERRARQVHADFLQTLTKLEVPPSQNDVQGGFHLLTSSVRTTDQILNAIRQELGQSQGDSNGR